MVEAVAHEITIHRQAVTPGGRQLVMVERVKADTGQSCFVNFHILVVRKLPQLNILMKRCLCHHSPPQIFDNLSSDLRNNSLSYIILSLLTVKHSAPFSILILSLICEENKDAPASIP